MDVLSLSHCVIRRNSRARGIPLAGRFAATDSALGAVQPAQRCPAQHFVQHIQQCPRVFRDTLTMPLDKFRHCCYNIRRQMTYEVISQATFLPCQVCIHMLHVRNLAESNGEEGTRRWVAASFWQQSTTLNPMSHPKVLSQCLMPHVNLETQ